MKLLVAMMLTAGAAIAAEMVVTDEAAFVGGSGSRITVSTQKAALDDLPDVGDPIFRFDCSQTNGWTFKDGTFEVLRIPSLVGSRFLSTSNNGGEWSR